MGELRRHGFSLDWGEDDGKLWIVMVVPTAFLARFRTPGDVLSSFLDALQNRGVNLGDTISTRTRIRSGATTLEWTGEAHGNIESIMKTTVKELMGDG